MYDKLIPNGPPAWVLGDIRSFIEWFANDAWPFDQYDMSSHTQACPLCAAQVSKDFRDRVAHGWYHSREYFELDS